MATWNLSDCRNDADLLKGARRNIRSALTRYHTFITGYTEKDELTADDRMKIKERYDTCKSLLSQYLMVQCYLTKFDEVEDDVSDEQFESKFIEANAVAQRLLDLSDNASTTSGTHVPAASDTRISNMSYKMNLPKIRIPQFSGNLSEWLEFKDAYTSMVHNREDLNDLERFHFLRSALVGEAASIVNQVKTTTENYLSAWDTMCKRYDDKRLLVSHHLDELFNLPCVDSEFPDKLKHLVDNVNRHLHALKSLDEHVDGWNTVLIHLILKKVDSQTRRSWRLERLEEPTYVHLLDFIFDRANLIDEPKVSVVLKGDRKAKVTSTHVEASGSTTKQQCYATTVVQCVECNQAHTLSLCPVYVAGNAAARRNIAIRHKVCHNCLRAGHHVRSCFAKSRCSDCGKRHHTSLHEAYATENPSNGSRVAEVQSNIAMSKCHVILPTACALVCGNDGVQRKCRVLLDSASQCNLISARFCKTLQLAQITVDMKIRGVGGFASHSCSYVEFKIRSFNRIYERTVTAFVVPEVTAPIPSVPFDRTSLGLPTDKTLSDKSFDKPGPVDLLIGTGHFWDIIAPRFIKLTVPSVRLQLTVFGWVVCGGNIDYHPDKRDNGPQSPAVNVCRLDANLERFWLQEEVPAFVNDKTTPEHDYCETLFVETTTRNADGRFVVRLPVSADILSAPRGESYRAAFKRQMHLEKRLRKHHDLRTLYNAFLAEYEGLHHMQRVLDGAELASAFYLPHHSVLKEDSETTKLRVVFDGSCKLSNDKSLNDYLYSGLPVQQELFLHIIKFRLFKYVVAADVAKMYRQVEVHPSDRHLQNILWRSVENEPLRTYQMNTLTYGTRPAAFLATRCLHEIGCRCQNDDVRRTIQMDFYVDDLMTGHDDLHCLKERCKLVAAELDAYKFPLRKWKSNASEIGSVVNNQPLLLSDDSRTSALGLQWFPATDMLVYKTASFKPRASVTKRSALSAVCQLFDPLGLLSPVTVASKIFMQTLWKKQYGWDDELQEPECSLFQNVMKATVGIGEMKVQRYISQPGATIQLHVFCDASQSAFGSCVYLRSSDSGKIQCHLMCAKSRLAPLKTVTIPRLELCAALLGAKLAESLCKLMGFPLEQCYFWSDSTITLAWLAMQPYQLCTYVSNRVARVQELTNPEKWRHVMGVSNPADLCTRGINVTELLDAHLWWNGPVWLKEPPESWPRAASTVDMDSVPELKCHVTQLVPELFIEMTKYSSYAKLLRIVLYARRFAHNLLSVVKRSEKLMGLFTADEYLRARGTLFLLAQRESFSTELVALSAKQALPSKSKLCSFTPFLDEDGILRIRGRLVNPDMLRDERQPALLSSDHHLAKLIFEATHKRMLHCGPQFLVAETRRFVWVMKARHLARKVCRSCVVCFKEQPRNVAPIMGNLPAVRTTPAPAFSRVGVDCAGPINVRSTHLRGSREYKSYIVIFVCLVTKAIHIELATEMSTEAFLAAFRRFCGRRGVPSDIYSDNGKNFVGAAKEFREEFNKAQRTADAVNLCSWHFIPPYAPHFGGIWEAAVKQAKYYLRRTLKDAVLTYEETTTLLCQIEAVLNSRPLCALSDDPTDLNPLTPAHFLIGRTMHAPPQREVPAANLRLRFRRVQEYLRQFWAEWSRAYLQSLQQRRRWSVEREESQVKVNGLVLVHEEGTPSRQWMCGRVIETSPGTDDVVRVATVKTAKGVIKRAVNRLYPLPIEQ